MRKRSSEAVVRMPNIGKADPVSNNATRAEILEVAAQLIVDRGLEACTMRAIAKVVNIKAGSLYYHFASKDQIIEEILNSGIAMLLDQVQGTLDELPKGTTFAKRIEVAIGVHIACMVHPDTAYMRVYDYLPPVMKRRSRAMRNKYADLWFRLFRDGISNGEVQANLDLTAFVPYFLGGLNRIPEWIRHKRFQNLDIAAMISSTLLKGISTGNGKAKA